MTDGVAMGHDGQEEGQGAAALTSFWQPPAVLAMTPAERSFQRLLLIAAFLALLTHVAFWTFFTHSGVPVMPAINIGSILCYVLAGLLLWRGVVLWAMALMAAEVAGHAVLAVYVVGWNSGFHYYLLAIVPVVMVGSLPGWWRKGAVCLLVAATYAALDLLRRQAEPWVQMDPGLLTGLHLFNLMTNLGILSLLAGVYFRVIHQTEQQLHRLATTDGLTRLLNRRHVLELVSREVARRRRELKPLAFLLVDVDHFKSVNDTHGHQAGDAALKAVATVLSKGVREIDYVARWGGEEFLVVLPGTDTDGALVVAERLRDSLARLPVHLPVRLQGRLATPPLRLTATLGLAVLHDEETIDAVIGRADAALYRGKESGRNRVVSA